MSEFVRAGAVVGLLMGVGLLLVYAGLPWRRRAGLAERVMPYLADAPRPSTLLALDRRHRTPIGEALAPVVAELGRGVERVMGGAPSVRRRLLRAGLPGDVERFRAEQVVWGAGGLAAGVGVALLLAAAGRGAPEVAVMVVLMGIMGAVAAADWNLTRRAQAREERMLAEFPTVAELLALAVSAGEGAIGALERVCRLSRGELSDELRRCLADARAGANLPTALQGLADRTGLVSLARFVDGIIVAVERGTPLAEVLRAQAQDVREEGRRAIMEEGGRKEIYMMVPVVFLILPVTILFAVFPGYSFLSFSI